MFYMGRATPLGLHGPTHHSTKDDAIIICHQSAHLGGYELLAKFGTFKVLTYLSNLRHILMVVVVLSGPSSNMSQHPMGDFAHHFV